MKHYFKKIVAAILELEARAILAKYKPKIVVVTGNVGKTSTKDAVAIALSVEFSVRKSEKSYNSEFGVPLTVLGRASAWSNPFLWLEHFIYGIRLILFPYPYPQWLVLEVGADRPHDIENLMKWVKPDVSVVTRIGQVPVHIEYFKNREALIYEKSHVARALKSDGVLILNGDDEDVKTFKDLVKAKTLLVSLGGQGDLIASHEAVLYENLTATDSGSTKVPVGIMCRLDYQGNSVPVMRKGTLGFHQIYPMISAIAVAVSQGVNLIRAAQAFENEKPTPGRMHLISGIKKSLIIDDSYNAAPVSTNAAIATLKNLKVAGKKIAILGDMLELGMHSSAEHEAIGALAATSCDILVTVGVRARSIAEGALDAGMNDLYIQQFDDSRLAGKAVEALVRQGDIVLVKGSQGMRMERAVKELMAEPERADELLVRQNIEWLEKA